MIIPAITRIEDGTAGVATGLMHRGRLDGCILHRPLAALPFAKGCNMPEDKDMLPPAEIMEQVPGTDLYKLRNWGQSGEVPRERDPRFKRRHLYSLNAVRRKSALYEASRPILIEKFPDGDFMDHGGTAYVWEARLRRVDGKSPASLASWKIDCPPLRSGVEKAPLRTVAFQERGSRGVRGYVVLLDYEKIINIDDAPDPAFWCDLRSAAALGFDGKVLALYSNSGKRRVTDFKPHPSLRRLIKTKRHRVKMRQGGRVVWRTFWLRRDLDDILHAPAPPDALWCRAKIAMPHYRLENSHLSNGVKWQRIKADWFAVNDGSKRPRLRMFYWRADLQAESLRVNSTLADAQVPVLLARRKRGRQKVSKADELDRLSILGRWKGKGHGQGREAFCSDQRYMGKPLTVKKFKAFQVWQVNRKKRRKLNS